MHHQLKGQKAHHPKDSLVFVAPARFLGGRLVGVAVFGLVLVVVAQDVVRLRVVQDDDRLLHDVLGAVHVGGFVLSAGHVEQGGVLLRCLLALGTFGVLSCSGRGLADGAVSVEIRAILLVVGRFALSFSFSKLGNLKDFR